MLYPYEYLIFEDRLEHTVYCFLASTVCVSLSSRRKCCSGPKTRLSYMHITIENIKLSTGGLILIWTKAIVAGALSFLPALGLAVDVERGAKLFVQCQSCHAIGPGADHKVGPHLNELFGRKAGSVEGFTYSDGLQSAGIDGLVWDVEHLDAYIKNPVALVTGTNMMFGGVSDQTDRADLIAFLRAYSVNPRDIPESLPSMAPSDPDVDPALLAIKGDAEYGEYLSSECITCHQSDGSDQGIPSITGWPEKQFVTVMHAYKSKARPHPVMQMMAANLADEEIAALAAYFKDKR